MKKLLFLLAISNCARVGYPPGKPELEPPHINVEMPEKFNHFPILINIKASDNTSLKSIEISINNRIYKNFHLFNKDTSFNIVIDTLKDFSDTLSQYNFDFKASDTYDNINTVRITTYYKGEENPPQIEILDSTRENFTVKLKDDTKLKEFSIIKNDSTYKNFQLFTMDTTLTIKIDTNLKIIKLKALDIYFNFKEMIFELK